MKHNKTMPIVISLFVAFSATTAAQTLTEAGGLNRDAPEVGNWEAFSRTAYSITGDISVSKQGIRFENGEQLEWREIERTQLGVRYAVETTHNPTLINGNTMCGNRSIKEVVFQGYQGLLFMKVSEQAGGLHMTSDPFDSTAMCGLYTYSAKP